MRLKHVKAVYVLYKADATEQLYTEHEIQAQSSGLMYGIKNVGASHQLKHTNVIF